jgi:tRNA threonylcarbamoyladenosine biosynthesis protein TsaB
MNTYLIMQSTYTDVEIGLAQQGNLIEKKIISKLEASRLIDTAIDQLLGNHAVNKHNLACIAANSGPGPFTTLRVVLATANGLGYGLDKPLVGIDGMEAFLEEHHTADHPITVALLNAFSNDVYFGIDDWGKIKIGWDNAQHFFAELRQQCPIQAIRFIGSGVDVYHQSIQELFGSRAVINSNIRQCSLEYCAQRAWKMWESKEVHKQLLPLYLKNQMNSMSGPLKTH